MTDHAPAESGTESESMTTLEEQHAAALQRVRAERDEALLRLLELEQEIAAHVCPAPAPQSQ